jgi:two-component system phosphate regulon sensor histidine kinase PhoR
MNKKLIILIIVLVSLALTGLMSIQIYWIRNAIKVKEGAFIQNVNKALSNVVLKLEQIDMLNKFKEQKRFTSNLPPHLQSLDSINTTLFHNLQKVKTHAEFSQFLQNSSLSKQFLDFMLDTRKVIPIKERIDEIFLDSLINVELQHYGIKTTFEYGVYNVLNNKMIFQKTGKYPQNLLNNKESFNYLLFPRDYQGRNLLFIYFPNEKQFLISQMGTLLGVSLLLIIIIILSFYYTINTVFKQKKLSIMRNDFINNMTHEFKTPISTIALACEALKDKDIVKTESLFDNYIGIIGEENTRLKVMAEKVLQTAILEKGELKLKLEWVNLNEIIQEVVKKIKIQVESKNGHIYIDIISDDMKLKADRMHLMNVILNLIDNANKYNFEEPEILVSTFEVDQGVIIEIKDNGIGISKENQKKIFDKLYRVPTGDVHNFKGFGLGLTYVKAIIDKHGGNINVISELNKGTTFKIFLPFGDIN